MKRLLLLLLPILGCLGVCLFHSPGRSWIDGESPTPPAVPASCHLPLPSGGSLALTRIFSSEPAVWLSSQEMSASEVSAQLGRPIPSLPNGTACCSYADASTYCERLNTALNGRAHARLPTESEWMQAARFDTRNAPYPWGWGPAPANIQVGRDAPPTSRGPILKSGFQDLAGGVWEWCQGAVIKGGAWSERNNNVLRIDAHRRLPSHYADLDVGFRVLIRFPSTEETRRL